jgi:hypothetical protein
MPLDDGEPATQELRVFLACLKRDLRPMVFLHEKLLVAASKRSSDSGLFAG